jgi:hypothetical protein
MFSGVCFTIEMANGLTMTPSYEVHRSDSLSKIITETYALCEAQNAKVLAVNVA